MTNYDDLVKIFIRENNNQVAKNDLIEAYNYIKYDFAKELALANRDYDLGLTDIKNIRNIQVKCYNIENKIRGYLGLAALPEINSSIL